MKHGFIITRQNEKFNQNSGLNRDARLQKKLAVKSAGKVMASVFWDADRILMIDYLPKGQTINGEYYANLLDKLHQCIQQKRPGLAKKESSSTKTTLGFTHVLKLWQKSTN